MCAVDFSDWYQKKKTSTDGRVDSFKACECRPTLFRHALLEDGHWKVNFLHKWVEEKGLV